MLPPAVAGMLDRARLFRRVSPSSATIGDPYMRRVAFGPARCVVFDQPGDAIFVRHFTCFGLDALLYFSL